MRRKDFLDLAQYADETWKGNYSPREVIENSSIYYSDYMYALKTGHISSTIKYLIDNLKEDIKSGETSEKVKRWLSELEGIKATVKM